MPTPARTLTSLTSTHLLQPPMEAASTHLSSKMLTCFWMFSLIEIMDPKYVAIGSVWTEAVG